jgi:asparagine synthase (glutamine-hydrolysing)
MDLSQRALRQKETYFDPREWEEQEPLDAESFYQRLRQSIAKSLPNYFEGPQTTGIALTGGMDTRVILAQCPPTPGSMPAYTFGSMFRDCRDVEIARKVADVCHQSHQVITVGNEFLNHFPHYAERTVYLTEGGVDVYRSADLYVSEKARRIAPAKVVGTYGSEIVRHAVMFKPMLPPDSLFRGDLIAEVRRAYDTYAAIRRVHPVTFAAFRQSPWYHHGVLALEQTQLTVRSPFLDNDFVAAVYRSPRNHVAPRRRPVAADRRRQPCAAANSFGSRCGRRARSRSSALARAWFEFTFKAEYACDYGMPQWAARINSWIGAVAFGAIVPWKA